MDLKTFADDDFDPKKWINKAWNSSDNQDKEVFVTNAVSRLQLYMKQLTNSLDETTSQVITSVPRVLQEASTLQTEGLMLQQQLLRLEEKVTAVEEETGHSIQSLQKIDRLKACLENAASTLREADKWAGTAQSLEDTLERGLPTQPAQLAELATQIHAMATSLDALTESPEYETKRLQLEAIYNRVEAGIASPMLDALANMDRETTVVYVKVYRAMRRVSRVCLLWRRAVAARASALWGAQPAAWNRHDLHRDITAQMQWLTDVVQVERPLIEIFRLYTDLLLSLDPSPSKVTLSKLKLSATPQEGIDYMTDVRAELDQILGTFLKLLDTTNQDKLPSNVLKDLGRAVYAPLRDCLPKYTELQTQAFNLFLENAKLKQEDLLEMSRALQNVVERSDNMLNNALSSARKIGNVASYPYLLPAIESLVTSLSNIISTGTRRVATAFKSRDSSGALSRCFPATLALAAAADALLLVVNERVNAMVADCDREKDDTLSMSTLLLDDKSRATLTVLRSNGPVLQSLATLQRSRASLSVLASDVLVAPASLQLEKIPSLDVWSDNDALSMDLPDFAISPQEYITEIGQYLMTLPQHLEMHLSEKQAPLDFLNEVCNQTCDLYAKKILSIRNMDALGTKRCLVDIDEQWERFMADKESCLARMKAECRQEGEEERVKREKELLEEISELRGLIQSKSVDVDTLAFKAAACGRTLAVTEQELREAIEREKDMREKRSEDAEKMKQIEKSSKEKVEHLTRKCACLRKLFDDIRAKLTARERDHAQENKDKDKEIQRLRAEVARLTKLLMEQSSRISGPVLGARTMADGCEDAADKEGADKKDSPKPDKQSNAPRRKGGTKTPEPIRKRPTLDDVPSLPPESRLTAFEDPDYRKRSKSVDLPAVQVPTRIKQLEERTKE